MMRRMNSFRFATTQLWNKKMRLLVQWLMVALGFGLISGFFSLQENIDDQLVSDIGDIDEVWTAKGSPLQGLLANVYHMDAPLGNIKLSEIEEWIHHPLIERYSRIGYGDTYKGRRILGTEINWPQIYDLQIREGKFPEKPMEVAISESLAYELELSIGSTFTGQHGEIESDHHHEEAYRVVGIFSESLTVADRIILTTLESVWNVHHIEDSEREVTAVLIKTSSPMAMFQLPRLINQNSTFQAILPSIEVNRIYSLLGNTQKAFIALSLLFTLLGTFSIAINLYEVMRSQQFDHTLLRVFGLSPSRLGFIVFLQSFILLGSAWLIGVFGMKLTLHWGMASIYSSLKIRNIPIEFSIHDTYLLIILILLSVLITLPIIIRIFRMSIHKNLNNA